MYASFPEFDYVLEQMSPRIEKAFLARGFVLLNWADAGWVHFFSKAPVRTPDDLKPLKLFVWAGRGGDRDLEGGRLQPRSPALHRDLDGPSDGLVNAVPTTPQAAVLLQWYQHAKNMADVRWGAPGGTVVSKAVWTRSPRTFVRAAGGGPRRGRRIRKEIRDASQRDVEAMKKRGLNVVRVDEAANAQWVKRRGRLR